MRIWGFREQLDGGDGGLDPESHWPLLVPHQRTYNKPVNDPHEQSTVGPCFVMKNSVLVGCGGCPKRKSGSAPSPTRSRDRLDPGFCKIYRVVDLMRIWGFREQLDGGDGGLDPESHWPLLVPHQRTYNKPVNDPHEQSTVGPCFVMKNSVLVGCGGCQKRKSGSAPSLTRSRDRLDPGFCKIYRVVDLMRIWGFREQLDGGDGGLDPESHWPLLVPHQRTYNKPVNDPHEQSTVGPCFVMKNSVLVGCGGCPKRKSGSAPSLTRSRDRLDPGFCKIYRVVDLMRIWGFREQLDGGDGGLDPESHWPLLVPHQRTYNKPVNDPHEQSTVGPCFVMKNSVLVGCGGCPKRKSGSAPSLTRSRDRLDPGFCKIYRVVDLMRIWGFREQLDGGDGGLDPESHWPLLVPHQRTYNKPVNDPHEQSTVGPCFVMKNSVLVGCGGCPKRKSGSAPSPTRSRDRLDPGFCKIYRVVDLMRIWGSGNSWMVEMVG